MHQCCSLTVQRSNLQSIVVFPTRHVANARERHKSVLYFFLTLSLGNMWSQASVYSLANEREQHREHFLHQQKLLAVRSCIDNKPPRARLGPNAKRLCAQREWSCRVQKDNRMLLNRMLEIDLKSTGPSKKPLPRSGSALSFHRSRESNRLAVENKQYKQRLEEQQSYYSTKQWQNEHTFAEYLLTKLSENSGHFARSQRRVSRPSTCSTIKRRYRSTREELVEV